MVLLNGSALDEVDSGTGDMWLCALRRWHTLSYQYRILPLDVAVKRAVDAFVTQRDALMCNARH